MSISIVRLSLSTVDYAMAERQILAWSQSRESRYICVANVHMLMEAHDSPAFLNIVNQADMVTPDGMPLVWMMRLKGQTGQQRVYGPTLMLHVLEAAVRESVPVGFYGGSDETLRLLQQKMTAHFPGLRICYAYSPPFRELSRKEKKEIVKKINESSAKILFVGLGCPKQEIWMAEHKGTIGAVMLGVGAAFDFHAGVIPQAPGWMQNLGLEWLFRFLSEPRRLWKRYLYHNPRFILLAIMDLLGFLK